VGYLNLLKITTHMESIFLFVRMLADEEILERFFTCSGLLIKYIDSFCKKDNFCFVYIMNSGNSEIPVLINH
jgi:hypothetical protein